jgi:hypothetical protein
MTPTKPISIAPDMHFLSGEPICQVVSGHNSTLPFQRDYSRSFLLCSGCFLPYVCIQVTESTPLWMTSRVEGEDRSFPLCTDHTVSDSERTQIASASHPEARTLARVLRPLILLLAQYFILYGQSTFPHLLPHHLRT